MDPNPPGNSKKARVEREPEAKEIKSVVQNKVTIRKKSLGKRMKETFLGGETQGVGQYLIMDVLIPAARDMIADVLTQGVERTILGDSAPRSRSSRGSRGSSRSRTNYNRMSGPLGRAGISDEPRRTMSHRARATHDFGEIVFETRVEADEALDSMLLLLERYDEVTVADFYQICGETAAFTDEKYGWTDLRGSGISGSRSRGYVIDLPNAEPLD